MSFYVLALSSDRVRLLKCTVSQCWRGSRSRRCRRFSGVCERFEEQRSVQFHSQAPPVARRGGRRGASNGEPRCITGRAGRRTMPIGRFASENTAGVIDNALAKALANESARWYACDTTLAGLYREVNSYRGLVDAFLSGSPDAKSDEEIRDSAWEVVAALGAGEEREGVGRLWPCGQSPAGQQSAGGDSAGCRGRPRGSPARPARG